MLMLKELHPLKRLRWGPICSKKKVLTLVEGVGTPVGLAGNAAHAIATLTDQWVDMDIASPETDARPVGAAAVRVGSVVQEIVKTTDTASREGQDLRLRKLAVMNGTLANC